MKRRELEAYLRAHGCILHHHGSRHDVWMNPRTATMSTVPRHGDVKTGTVRSICKALHVPMPRGR